MLTHEDMEAAAATFSSLEDNSSPRQNNYARPSSPPPDYSEATKFPPLIREKVAAQRRELLKYSDAADGEGESPPDYAAAVAIMAAVEEESRCKATAPPLEDEEIDSKV